MKVKYEHRKVGKKHLVDVRYTNEQKEDLYQVFEAKSKKAAMKKAKEAMK